MKKLAIVAALLLVAFTACKKEEQQEQKNEPIANFEIRINQYYDGSWWQSAYESSLYVGIRNLSENADSYQWEWGDGKYDGRTHPRHQYNSAGTYTITLTAENSDGYTSTKSKTITVE